MEHSGEAWWKEEGVSRWVRELIRVRSVGIAHVGGLRVNELPLIKGKAREHYPNARLVGDGVRSLLQDVVSLLPKSFQSAAEYEFGLIPAPGASQQTSAARRAAAADALGYSLSAFRHNDSLERELLEKAAETLSALDRLQHSRPSDTFAGTYILREALHRDLDDVVATMKRDGSSWQRRNVVIVRGEPGCGTSRLAYEHFRSRGMTRIPAVSESTLLASACHVLERSNREVAGDGAGIRHQFGKLLSSGDAPRVVLFDDVPDINELFAWFPERLRCLVVIVTSQQVPPGLAPVVEVGPLEDHEIVALLADRSPSLATHEAWQLGVTVGRRIRTIEQVARLLDEMPGTTGTELIDALLADVQSGLDAAAAPGEVSLTTVYRTAIDEVLKHHVDSLSLLTFLAFAGHPNLTERCFMAFAAATVEGAFSAQRRLSFLAKIRPLIALGLLHQDQGRYYLDPLTAHIVRQYTTDRTSDVLGQVICTVGRRDDTTYTIMDLAEQAWTPADIAAFFVCIFTMQARLDPKQCYAGYTGTGVNPDPRADLTASEEANEYWERLYFLMRGLEVGSSNAVMAAEMLRALPRQTTDQLIQQWILGTQFFDLIQGPAMSEIIQLISEEVSTETVDAWLVSLEIPLPQGQRRKAQWKEAYRAFIMMRLWGENPDLTEASMSSLFLAQMSPDLMDLAENGPQTEREVAELCLEMVRRTELMSAYTARGARMEHGAPRRRG